MVIYEFKHAGTGRVVCHGDPPLVLRIGTTEYPCPDPAAEWCAFEPVWSEGTHALVCVNGTGESPQKIVEVPEVGLVPGLLVGLLCAWAMGWLSKGGVT